MKIYFYLLLLFCVSYSLQAQTENERNKTTVLTGRVIDQDGKPLSNVLLQASGAQTHDISNNPNGDFRIPMLLVPQSQDIAITVTLEGYYLSQAIIPNIVIIKAEDRQKTLTIQLTKKPLPTGKKRIAVLPFCDDSPQDAPLINGAFTAKAAEALSQIDQQNLETIDHMLVWTAMQRNKLRNDNYCDMEQIMKLSNDINANVVVMGMYQRDDTANEEERWRVDCSFFDLSNNRPYYKAISETAPSLPILQKKLYNEILKRLEISTTFESEQIIESYTTKTTQNEQSYTHFLNGSQYNTQQEPQKAKKELNQSIEYDKNNFRAYEERAIAEASSGNTEQAQKDYQEAERNAERKGINLIKKQNLVQNDLMPSSKNLPNNIKVVKVKGGTFMMGCNKERDGSCVEDANPVHEVTLSDYYIGQTEVTNAQYLEFLNKYESDTVKAGEYKGQKMVHGTYHGLEKEKGKWKVYDSNTKYENYPVVGVTWYGANEFCKYYGGSLPSEAQWEYAARGGTKSNNSRHAGGDNFNDVGFTDLNPVASKKPNELILYDMSGNALEWCQDWYDYNYYEKSIILNPLNLNVFLYRSVRSNNKSISYREKNSPSNYDYYHGFRVCMPSD